MPLLWISEILTINTEYILSTRINSVDKQLIASMEFVTIVPMQTNRQFDTLIYIAQDDFAITCYSQLRELGILMPNKEIDDFVTGELNCQKNNPLLNTPIEDFTTSVRVYNCLKRGQIKNLGMLLNSRWSELVKIHNFGRHSWHELVLFIAEINNQHGTNFKLLDQ